MGAKQPASSASSQQRPDRQPSQTRGTVQHVYRDRGFGFIRCTEGAAEDVGEDFFFHTSGLDEGVPLEALLPGSLVEFDARVVPRGKRAEHVHLV